jgi:arsenite methyltransferase
VRGEVSPTLRRDMELWVGCIAGALDGTDYAAKLGAAGFQDVDVETWRVYEGVAAEGEGKFASAFIRARKP